MDRNLPSRRITLILLIVILLLAVFMRVPLRREELFYPDSCIYLALAENMKHGEFARALKPDPAVYQPLYPLSAAALSLFGTGMENAGVLVSFIAGLGLILILYLLGRNLYGPFTGFAAALLAAMEPTLAILSTEILTEMLFVCLYTLAMLVCLRSGRQWRPWLFFGCGILSALAFAARLVGISALPMAVLWTLLLILPDRSEPAGKRLRRSAAAALLVSAGFMLTVSPHVIRIRLDHGFWGLTGFENRLVRTPEERREKPDTDGHSIDGSPATGTGAENIADSDPVDKEPLQMDDSLGRRSGVQPRIADHPAAGDRTSLQQNAGETVENMLEKLTGSSGRFRSETAVAEDLEGYFGQLFDSYQQTFSLLWPVIILIGVVFWVCLNGWRGFFPPVYLLSWLIPPMIITVFAQTASGSDELQRYLTPLIPVWILLTGAGVTGMVKMGTKLWRRTGRGSADSHENRSPRAEKESGTVGVRLSATLVLTLILSALLYTGSYRALFEKQTGDTGRSMTWYAGAEETAAFIREWSSAAGIEKSYVMDRKPFAVYLAGAWWASLPDLWPREVIHRARQIRVNLLVVDSAAVAGLRPKMTLLVSGETIPDSLNLVYHRFFSEQERVVAVYQINHNGVGEGWMAPGQDHLDRFRSRTPSYHFQEGRRLYDNGRIHEAGLHFRRAIILKNDYAQAFYHLGNVYFRESMYLKPDLRFLGVFDEALYCYREAVRLEPRAGEMVREQITLLERNLSTLVRARVYRQLGGLYRTMGREQDADEVNRHADTLAPVRSVPSGAKRREVKPDSMIGDQEDKAGILPPR